MQQAFDLARVFLAKEAVEEEERSFPSEKQDAAVQEEGGEGPAYHAQEKVPATCTVTVDKH